jgi:magnesium transporter
MISVYSWNRGQQAGLWLTADVLRERIEQFRKSTDTIWIDLENPTPEEEELVFRRFLPIHPLTLEDVTKLRREPDVPPHFPKAEEFPDYLFVVVNPRDRGFHERLWEG